MSYQADQIFVEQYNSRLSIAYQPQGWLLQGMVMPEGSIEGKKAHWPRYGRRVAKKKVRGVRATPDNPTMDDVTADLQTWETFQYINKFDLSRMKANEREAAVQAGAMAMGQSRDAEIMAMLNTAAPTSGAGYLDTSGGQLTPAQMMLIFATYTGGNNIPVDGQIFAGVPMIVFAQLMADPLFANSQWNGGELPFLKRSTGRTWNFVNWVQLPDEYFPVPSANKADFFFWHKPAVGWSNNVDIETWWVWDNELGAWSVRQESEGAGVVIRPEGVARVRYKTNVTSITPR